MCPPIKKNIFITEEFVAHPLPDGYWLGAFPFKTDDSEYPDLIGFGLGSAGRTSGIKLFRNPANNLGEQSTTSWEIHEIQRLEFPVSMTYADLTGNGYNDIIICDRYGPHINQLWDAHAEDGGRTIWLENPGRRDSSRPWEIHSIGKSTGTHRLGVGQFTRTDDIQIVAAPIVPSAGNFTSPAPVILFTPNWDLGPRSSGPRGWVRETPFPSSFRIVHDLKVVPKDPDTQLDTALLAGREGISHIWYDLTAERWRQNRVGEGAGRISGNPFWGSGSVAVGRVDDDSVGYIATCEALHGNNVAVYVKGPNAPKGPESLKSSSFWTRILVDSFGPLNSEHGGTVHYVTCGRFDSSKLDSFVIACMGDPVGRSENLGVYLYTPATTSDLAKGIFKKTKVSESSASLIALAEFNNPAILDIASISYSVPGFPAGPNPPSVRVFLNNYTTEESRQVISVARIGTEALLRVPRPSSVDDERKMPMIEVAGKKLWLYVLPPGRSIDLDIEDGVKVLHGEVSMRVKGDDFEATRGIAIERRGTAYTELASPTVTAGSDGAVFLWIEHVSDREQPLRRMDDFVVKNVFPTDTPQDVQRLQFPFNKVEDLCWAGSGLWNDFEFYNMTGFYIFFNDGIMEPVVHMQLWTLGLGETARFHNHDAQAFCEVHMCIFNGGDPEGDGSDAQAGCVRYFEDDFPHPIDVDREMEKDYVERNSTKVRFPGMSEHGPFWKVKPGNQFAPQLRPNGTADYPWHGSVGGAFGGPRNPANQAFDLWIAFEFPLSAFPN